jgi:hypothetical protein
MTDKTALLRKSAFGLCGVLAGVILALFSVSAAMAQSTPPAAHAQHVKGSMNSAISITLSGSDQDGDSLTYEIIQQPAYGTLSGTAPNVSYSSSNAEPSDSFTFRVSDGTHVSTPATVMIDRFIEPAKNNVAPVGHNQVLAVDISGGPVSITLSGSDAEGDPLEFQYEQPNCPGALSGTAPNLTYDPTDCYETDGFNFKVQSADGRSSGDLARIDIYLIGTYQPTALDDAPGPTANAGGDINIGLNDPHTLNGDYNDPIGRPLVYEDWYCNCEPDCTLEGDDPAAPTLTVTTEGEYNCWYSVETGAEPDLFYASDTMTVDAPSARTGSVLLLASVCALIGMRYTRKSAVKNV